MKPWVLLGEAGVPGSSQPLRLYRRDEEFSIRAGRFELMNSRKHGSEEALAELACDRLEAVGRPRVLIGGLGMGFTLAAALRRLPADARLTVAELVPEVVAWNRGPLGAVAGDPLEDPRVAVEERDVVALLGEPGGKFHAILLDVDNGPDALTHPGNARLYSPEGLVRIGGALAPGGVLAVWSAEGDPGFLRRLRRTGFAAVEHRVRARAGKGRARHIVWIARHQRG